MDDSLGAPQLPLTDLASPSEHSPADDFGQGVPPYQVPLAQNVTPAAPSLPDQPWIENPVWSGLDLLIIAIALLLAVVIFTGIAMGVLMTTPQFRGTNIHAVTDHPSMYIVVPAMAAAYAAMLAVLYLLAVIRGQRFWKSLSWNWPSGNRWAALLCAGAALSLVAGGLQKILPTPKALPIEDMFREPGAAWFLAILGTAIAPFVEEVLFRGLLYPVANRWLRDVLNSQQRIRRARLVFLFLIPWGFAAQRVSGKALLLMAMVVVVVTGAAFLIRSLAGESGHATRVILPGLAFLFWGQTASHLSQRWVVIASLVVLGTVLLMTMIGLKQPGPETTRFAIGLSVVVTAAAFAMIHGEQLAQSWAPLLVLFMVGLVLTLTRAVTKSVASSFLIHLGYNSTLFGLLYLATDHFRHMERMAR